MTQPVFGMPGFDWSQWAQGLAGLQPPPSQDGTITVTGQRPVAAPAAPAASVLPAAAPSIAGAGGGLVAATGASPAGVTQLGFNVPTAQLALSGLSTLAGLWNGIQQMNLAKKAFNFQKDFANTNLRNQTQSYNTQMEDRINSRYFTQGMSQQQAQDYLTKHRLTLPASAAATGRG